MRVDEAKEAMVVMVMQMSADEHKDAAKQYENSHCGLAVVLDEMLYSVNARTHKERYAQSAVAKRLTDDKHSSADHYSTFVVNLFVNITYGSNRGE